MTPYEDQPPRAFWKKAVAERSPLDLAGIYRPRFPIDRKLRISAAGSCFAQHIGRQFKTRGFNFTDLEKAPDLLPEDRLHAFGYDLYSARYGNVYTIRQMVQMFARASGELVPDEDAWTDERGRVRDPFRPGIEPEGFASVDEMRRDREWHLGQVSRLLAQTDLFVFTFGLTEAWECTADGVALPTCPGTVGGTFDAGKYRFHNFTFSEIMADAEAFIALARTHNPDMKFIFTVSPVPLTATATDDHVLPATIYSKSVLRAVCGELRDRYDFVDYFPSYELVASHPMRGMFFEPNLRSVASPGVAIVMDTFFKAHRGGGEDKPPRKQPRGKRRNKRAPLAEMTSDADLVCEEEMLETYAR